jgi:hypothetical protein
VNRSHKIRVRLDEFAVHLDCPFSGDPRTACQASEIDEIKATPCTPRSHAFVERLIGTVRREYLDQTLFWNQSDLERKLETYKAYYNQYRCHSGLAGATPAERSGVPSPSGAKLESYSWRKHCNGLFQTPIAARI